jgi:hypothetical protein
MLKGLNLVPFYAVPVTGLIRIWPIGLFLHDAVVEGTHS